jgi:hypothetical protein
MTREEILATEYSPEFDKLRQNMMVMSFYKYGHVKENAYSGMEDFLKSLDMRYEKFKATKNVEYLADIANICMMIFMYPEPFGCHYRPTDSSESCGIHGISVQQLKEEMEGIVD